MMINIHWFQQSSAAQLQNYKDFLNVFRFAYGVCLGTTGYNLN